MKVKKKILKYKGTVYLVGAGPGDVGLLTLRAKECLEKADIVFYDSLVNTDILRFSSRAKLCSVGKKPYHSHITQKKIESLLIKAAKKYRNVVRLKGGDPFIFGRGGEEGEALAQAKVPFEVIPGVTSAVAVPAYAGIPLTHRDFGGSVTFVTGHGYRDERNEKEGIDWKALVGLRTIVFLMGVQSLGDNFKKLVAYGMDPTTPAVIIEWGTYPFQRTVEGTILTLPELVQKKKIFSPAITVVGEIVRLRGFLNWFEKKPLFGKKILVTRAAGDLSGLSEKLKRLGGEPLEIPSIEIQPISRKIGIDRAIRNLANFDWLVFTSRYGVKYFFERLFQKGLDLRVLKNLKIAAVGESTAKWIREYGIQADFIPTKFTGKDLAKEIPVKIIFGKRILFPRGEKGRDDIIRILKQRGGLVFPVTVYRTVLPKVSKTYLKALFEKKIPDLLTFSSSSQVKNIGHILKKTSYLKKIKSLPSVVIGPTTKKTAREMGFKKIFLPNDYSLDGLVETAEHYFEGRSRRLK